MAAAYALCVVAPALALAFIHGPTALHCLTDQHGIVVLQEHATMHVHADGTTHRHLDGATHKPHQNPEHEGKSHPGDCCGLFCMTALASKASFTLGTPTHFRFERPLPDEHVAGRGPDRINRPPIV